MRPLFAILLLAFLPGSVGSSSPNDSSASEVAVGDLLIHGVSAASGEPLRMRLVVTDNGVPWAQRYNEYQRLRGESLFRQLDSNRDGELTPAEAKRLPSPSTLTSRQPTDVYVAFNFRVLDDDSSGGATPEELADYLRQFSGQPLRLRTVSRKERSTIGHDLFVALDTNGDGVLVQDEWSVDMLQARDADGNRVLTQEELRRPTASLFGPEFVAAPLGGHGSTAVKVQLVAATTPADATCYIAFAEGEKANLRVDFAEQFPSSDFHATTASNGDLILQLDQQRIAFRVQPSDFRRTAQFQSAILREFAAAEQLQGGTVSIRSQLPQLLATLAPLADADGDGTLLRSELKQALSGYVTSHLAIQTAQLQLTVVEQEADLASLIDQNLDSRLGARELARLPAALSACANSAGEFKPDEVSQHVAIIFRRGEFDEMETDLATTPGPPWFSRADRNQDGDLDGDEFPGPTELFARLDRNGDGWIELEEAIAGEQLLRSTTSQEVTP